jgi:hypothetical protein
MTPLAKPFSLNHAVVPAVAAAESPARVVPVWSRSEDLPVSIQPPRQRAADVRSSIRGRLGDKRLAFDCPAPYGFATAA